MKTPKLLRTAIADYDRAVFYTMELIRVKATVPEENQAAHVKAGHPALWIARLEGQYVMLEAMLHAAKCYNGFYYVDPSKHVEGKAPMQSAMVYDWAKHYLTKD